MKKIHQKINKMSSQEINESKAFKLSNGGIVRSVSVIFYSEGLGYLLCDEMRKTQDPTKRILGNHMIGGKVEMDDVSPLWCGLRELIEELDFYLDGRDKTEMIKYLGNQLSECRAVKWDYCVSVPKKLYNRFYVIGLDHMQDEEQLSKITGFLLNWKKKDDSTLERVYFWNGEELPVKTSLLVTLMEKLPSPSLLK